MKKFKIAYYEDSAYLKIFKAKTKEDALKKAWSNTPQDFFEWCSLYDDLKHIKQKEVA
jgi:hypothetical protein